MTLTPKYIKSAYEAYYGVCVPNNIIQWPYRMLRCRQCKLEYSDPLDVPTEFYPWVTRQNDYYPKQRPEWNFVLNRFSMDSKSKTLLEVGCGSGSFLDCASLRSWKSLTGVDLTASAIDLCRQKGHNAYCCDIARLLELLPKADTKYDLVVGFHLLEHVADPLGLAIDCASLLRKPNGRLLLSLPLSPNDHENCVFDPILYPPHHLTRWQLDSFDALKETLGMEMRVHMIESRSFLKQISHALFCYLKAANQQPTKTNRAKLFLSNPMLVMREVAWQYKRSASRPAPSNHVLAEFYFRD